jgi:hypothetical protein
MTEKTIYFILALIMLIAIVFLKYKLWWKILNLTSFIIYFSISLYGIYTDPIMNGFAPIVLTIIIMAIHIGILFLSSVFLNKYIIKQQE